MAQTINYRLAVKFATGINKNNTIDDLTMKKIILGCEVILINISKSAVFFLAAWVLGVIPQTLMFFVSFNLVRKTGFGLHATTSTGCTVISTLLFVALPYLFKDAGIGSAAVLAAGVFILAAVYRYAPASTTARNITNVNKRKRLKKQCFISCLILIAVLLAVPYENVKLICSLGALSQIITMLPITYKLLGREVV